MTNGQVAYLAIALVFVACFCQQPPTPRVSSPAAPLAPSSTQAPDASVPAHPQFVALDALRPLTARPNYAAIARAVDLGTDQRALELVSRQLHLFEAPAPELQRWHLWLGYAYRKRNEDVQALHHFEQASTSDWLLSSYARLAQAETLSALGRADDALNALRNLRCTGPVADAASLLQALIWSQTGRVQQAIPVWRAYLKRSSPAAPEYARVNLLLAEALISVSTGHHLEMAEFADGSVDALQQEAFERLEPVQAKDLDVSLQQRAVELRRGLIATIMAGRPLEQQQCKLSDRIAELESLVERREVLIAVPLAQALLDELKAADQLSTPEGCRAQFLMAQLNQINSESKVAGSLFDSVASSCQAPEDLVARALFQNGRRALDRHELTDAIAQFETLERRFPGHRLADDARLRLANAYLELGSEAKFVDLISRMPDDFPTGDQVPEGLFQLALHRMIKGDWAGTASLLTTMGKLTRIEQHEDSEQTERQMYFLARAQLETGQTEAALITLEKLVRERPFSYYMLLAYTKLLQKAPDRAIRARDAGSAVTPISPFVLPYQPELDTDGFARAMELLAIGESDKGSAELKALGLSKDLELQLLWAKAAFEAAFGELKASQRIVRERFHEWPRYWPSGAWEKAWKVAFPQPYSDIVKRETARTGVPMPLVYAVMREESLFDQDAVSSADAQGLMQLIEPTARRAAKELGILANARTLKQPAVNIALGCQVLKKLFDRFSKQPLLVIPAYNAGPGRPKRWNLERPDMDFDIWVESIPFAETRTYFKHVLASRAAYAWLYDHDQAEVAMRLPLRISE